VACVGLEEEHRGFWWGNLKEGNLLEDLSIDRRITWKCIFKKRVCTVLIWLSLGRSGEPL
jgi:hypothetical protein